MPASAETRALYFIGVTTGESAVNDLFPRWAEILDLEGATLVGVDLPLHAPPAAYRRVLAEIKETPEARGALVTSHKLDLLAATRDMFAGLDAYAQLCQEVSCIVKQEGQLWGRATDPVAAGEALELLAGPGYWRERAADVLCLGAGGAGVALTTYLLDRRPAGDRPRRLLLVDIDQGRLQALQRLVQKLSPAETEVDFIHHREATENDRLLATLPPGSLVINATGMGKDIPGSPLTAAARFPQQGLVWELNYRGPRPFYRQALAQAEARALQVADGWHYFLSGWARIIAAVFQIDISAGQFARLAEAAAAIR